MPFCYIAPLKYFYFDNIYLTPIEAVGGQYTSPHFLRFLRAQKLARVIEGKIIWPK